jgi:hypothetical protein
LSLASITTDTADGKPNVRAGYNPRAAYRRMLCVAFGHEVNNFRFGLENAPANCPDTGDAD